MGLPPTLTENRFLLSRCPNWYEMTFIICSGSNSADHFYGYKVFLITSHINNCMQLKKKRKEETRLNIFLFHVFVSGYFEGRIILVNTIHCSRKWNKRIKYFLIYIKTFRWSESESVLKKTRLKDVKASLYGRHMSFLGLG